MEKEILAQAGLSETQATIYLYLIKNGQKTASEVTKGVGGNRTTIYSALEKLEKLGVITKKDRGKISAYSPNHPSILEDLAEKRLRIVARQARNLEGSLPSLINYYNEYQDTPGVVSFYGKEGVKMIWDKIIAENQPLFFVRSKYDSMTTNKAALNEFKERRVEAGIKAENITSSVFASLSNKEAPEWLLERTLLPSDEYDSPVEIDIFGNNVAFINYEKGGMSTLIESPEIAEAMRQMFLFAKKYIRKATDQKALDKKS